MKKSISFHFMKNLVITALLVIPLCKINAQTWSGSTSPSGDAYRAGNIGLGFSSSPGTLGGNLVINAPSIGVGPKQVMGSNTIIGGWGSSSTAVELQSTTYSIMALFSNINSGHTVYDKLVFAGGASYNGIFNYSVGRTPSTTLPLGIIVSPDAGTTLNYAFAAFPNGQVGIGINPASYSSAYSGTTTKLAVEGTISCRELKVIPTGTAWPDYVFAKNYKLMSLSAVEKYIDKNKHLPQFNSAAVMEKEGVSVGETQRQLVQSVEELYLHVIALEKENQLLKKQISSLKKKH